MDSLVVTHPTTKLPIYSFNMGERTGSLVLCSLWSYVAECGHILSYILYGFPMALHIAERRKHAHGEQKKLDYSWLYK